MHSLLDWGHSSLLPLNIGAAGSWPFELRPRLTLLDTVGLELLDLDWKLHHWLSWASSLQTADSQTSEPLFIIT